MTDRSLDAMLVHAHRRADGDYAATVIHDVYPSLADGEDRTVTLVLGHLLETLPDDDRRCVEMVVLAGMSYREAAEHMRWWLKGGKPNGKRVWRAVRRSLKRIRADLDSGWKLAFIYHRLEGQ